jgi:hypothetical protein
MFFLISVKTLSRTGLFFKFNLEKFFEIRCKILKQPIFFQIVLGGLQKNWPIGDMISFKIHEKFSKASHTNVVKIRLFTLSEELKKNQQRLLAKK